MIIAGFDLATTTGACDGAVGVNKPRVWSWDLRDGGEGRPARLLMLGRLLRRYFVQEAVDAVVYEAPLNIAVMGRIGAADDVVAFLRGAIGVLEMTAAEYGKPVEAVDVQDARHSVLGWRINLGGGKKRKGGTKERVLEEVRRIHGINAESDNEADAYVVWQYACNRENPRLAVAMTPLFRRAGQ